MYVAGILQILQSCQCMLQECFKHSRGVCYSKHPNHVSVCCRSASNTTIISGVHIAGAYQTPIMSGVYVAGVLQTPIHVSVCLQERFKHPNNIRNVYCRSISNTPIMSGVYVCCRNASNIPILSVYVAGVLQTPQ